MIAVIFEVIPKAENKEGYLALGQKMGPLAEQIDGFISIERFQSLTNPEKLLSLSLWRDEDALNEWRNVSQHRAAQKAGRENYFDDYRLRVVSVLRDYGLNDRDEAPEDSKALHG